MYGLKDHRIGKKQCTVASTPIAILEKKEKK